MTYSSRHQVVRVRRSKRLLLKVSFGRLSLLIARTSLLLIILALPFMWGGRHPVAIGFIGLTLGVSAIFWLMATLFRRDLPLQWPSGLNIIVLMIVVGTIQLIPQLFDVFASPSLEKLWDKASIFASMGEPILAIAAYEHTLVLLALVTIAVFTFLVAQYFQTTKAILFCLVFLSFSITVNALIGLWQATYQPSWFLWQTKETVRIASGGFLNQDHFASFCVMGFFLALGFVLTLTQRTKGSLVQRLLPRQWHTPSLIYFAFSLLILFIAIIFSYSRAAILSLIGGIVFFSACLLIVNRRKEASIALILSLGVLTFAGLYGLDRVLDRLLYIFTGTDHSALMRFEIWALMPSIIMLSPWLGSGFASTVTLSPLFDTSFAPGAVINDAHCLPLELASNLGLPITILISGLLIYWYLVALYRLNYSARKHSSLFPIALGCLTAITAAMLHAMVDYALKQPANIVALITICIGFAHILERLTHKESTVEIISTSSKPFSVILKGGAATLLLSTLIALTPSYLRTIENGFARLKLLNVTAHSLSISSSVRYENQREFALDVLSQAPKDKIAIEAYVTATLLQIESDQNHLLATYLSQYLDQNVDPNQVDKPIYRDSLPHVMRLMSKSDRESIAYQYISFAKAINPYLSTSPANALMIAFKAQLLDRAGFWASQSSNTAPLYWYALNSMPHFAPVLAIAVPGLLNQWREQPLVTSPRDLPTLEPFITRLLQQKPNELTRILDLYSELDQNFDSLLRIVPNTIRCKELFSNWLIVNERFEEAKIVLQNIEHLNSSRLEDETPWAMGTLDYLQRERRSINEIQKSLDSLWSQLPPTYITGEDQYRSDSRRASIQAKELTRELNRIDQLISEGKWLLAEVALKALPQRPEVVIRQAELVYAQGRMTRVDQLVKQLETISTEFDDETKVRFEKLKLKLTPSQKALQGSESKNFSIN